MVKFVFLNFRSHLTTYVLFGKGLPPPERFLTDGAVGVYQLFPQLLEDADLLKDLGESSDDPNVLRGVPCCPGTVEGVVRVATTIDETSVSEDTLLHVRGHYSVM